MILHELLIDPAVFLHKHLVSFVITLDSRIFVELDMSFLTCSYLAERQLTWFPYKSTRCEFKMSFFSEMCKG